MTTTLTMIRAVAAAFAILLLSGGLTSAQMPSIIEGTWLTPQLSEMTIATCPEGFCGRISKIVVPQKYVDQYGAAALADPASYVDALNEDPNLRSRPIMDLNILTLKAGSNAFRYDGLIYNPEDGKTYEGYLEVLGADKIKLNGCILYGTVCQGQEWTRVIPPPDATADAPIPAPATARPK